MSNNKTTHELEKRLDHHQSLITDVEADIGKQLFLMNSEAVSQHQVEYTAFEEKRTNLCADIEAIRTLVEQRQLFRNDLDVLHQQMDALTTNWNSLYEGLGVALADSPNAIYDKEFDSFREPIAELRHKDKEARVALDNLKDQMANQSFMNRLLTQVQYTARNKAVVQLEKKLATLYTKCGKTIFNLGILVTPFEEGQLSDSVSEAYSSCNELKSKADKLQELVDACTQRLEENKQSLIEKGVVSDNPDKRIKSINKDIDLEIQKQRDLCQACGHDFSAKYIDPDGEILENYPSKDDIYPKLEQVARIRQDKVIYSRKIQIINLSNQIDSVSKKITSFRATIMDNEEKISSLQERNRELEDKISISQSEKDQLQATLSQLELDDAQCTKRLEN